MKTKNGFTLIEIVLVVGLIAVMTIGIYLQYNKKYGSQAGNLQAERIYMLAKNINNLLKNQDLISGTNQAAMVSMINTSILGTSNLSNLNSTGIIPEGMYDPQTKTLVAIGGATINVKAAIINVGATPYITLNESLNLAAGECASFIGNPLVWKESIKIDSGSSVIKDTNGTIDLTKLDSVCKGSSAINVYYPLYQQAFNKPVECDNCGSTRDKEQKYHIPTNSNVAMPASAQNECIKSGGGWNNTTSTCTCGASAGGTPQQWNGTQCVAIWDNSTPNNNGLCPLGFGWRRDNAITSKCVQLQTTTTAPSGQPRIQNYLEGTQVNKRTGSTYTPKSIITATNNCQLNGGSGCPAPNYNPSSFTSTPGISIANNNNTTYWRDSGRLIPSNIGFQNAGGPNQKIGNFSLSNMPNAQTTNLGVGTNLTLPKYAVIQKTGSTPIGGMEGNKYNLCVQSGGVWDVDRCVTPNNNSVSDTVKEAVRIDTCRRNNSC